MRVALVALLLAGCTTWTHPTKTAADFERESYECQKDAAPVQDAFSNISMRKACMRMKGWKD